MLITNLVDAYHNLVEEAYHKFGGGCLAQNLVVDAHLLEDAYLKFGGCLAQFGCWQYLWRRSAFTKEVC